MGYNAYPLYAHMHKGGWGWLIELASVHSPSHAVYHGHKTKMVLC